MTTVTRREVWVEMLLYPRHTLPTAFAPVLVGSALAWHDGVFDASAALAAFAAGWLIQLGGVIADNYNNLRRHGDDREHPRFVEALKAGVVTLAELRRAVLGCHAGAVVAGLYLVYLGGLPVLVIGVLSIAASLAYSSGPYPLGDNFGLGDPLFFVFFGVVSVMGSYYVQVAAHAGQPLALTLLPAGISSVAFMASLPMGALCTNILVIDNIRDLRFDRDKKEHTLAVLVGPRASHAEYVALLVLAYAVPVVLFVQGRFGWPVVLPVLSIPYAVHVARRVLRTTDYAALLPMTPHAAQVLLAHAVLFAAGLALG
jgi:1,4-dihydroxy-2-naphthoate octaprenyltransferase